MSPALRPCGDHAILVDLPDEQSRRVLDALLRARRQAGSLDDVVEQIPGARTVLVRFTHPDAAPGVADVLRRLVGQLDLKDPDADDDPDLIVVPVRYDGEDLEPLAYELGVTADELVAWHTERPWVVDFTGFMPGFGYLVRDPDPLSRYAELDTVSVPRLTQPRTRVPAGSVALAARWSAIYPQASPGGWQLIGRTDTVVWDATADTPALLRTGGRVSFEALS